jgi:hypothetical protein
VKAWTDQHHLLHWVAPAVGAIAVVLVGKWLAAKAAESSHEAAGEKAA